MEIFTVRVRKFLILCISILVLISLTYIYMVPKHQLGNIFFGGIPSLYNLKIAHFFYNQALFFDTEDGFPPPYTHYQISRIHFINGDLIKAMKEIDLEFESYPYHAHTYYIKGLTLGYMNREQEAIESFSKFIDYKPDSWAARNDKAWLQFRIGDIDGAVDTIIPAAIDYPNNPWVLNTFGVLLMNQGHLTESKNALEKALELSLEMEENDWGIAYPGNSPSIYGQGLSAMRDSIKENINQVEALTRTSDDK